MTLIDAELLPARTPAGDSPGDAVPTIDLTERSEQTAARPTFTITDAAAACAVSRKTITRKLGDLALHGAAKDDDGIWRIPVEALLAVGLHPGRSLPGPGGRPAGPPPPQPARPAAVAPAPDTSAEVVTVPRQRWDDLRIRLARAEAEAAERALALADARLALRALTAGPARSTEGAGTAAREEPMAASTPPAVPGGAGPVSPIALEAAPPRIAEPVNPAPAAGVPTSLAAPDPAAQLAAARSHAAQNGGYVPAAPAVPPRKRRWWQSK